jgi:thioredoxin reductase (NADPH)
MNSMEGLKMSIILIGARYCQEMFKIGDFLARNHVEFTWEYQEIRRGTPEVQGPGFRVINPSPRQLGRMVGLCPEVNGRVFDLAIVGGGPAGLSAAVSGSSEGLSVVVLERVALGGQAGRSMRIENYLGFPQGLTGSELSQRARDQAIKFGATLCRGIQAIDLDIVGDNYYVNLDDKERIQARTVLIATGADYRKLDLPNRKYFEGRGIYYAATPIEVAVCHHDCPDKEVAVVGGGNSAGQAALWLATQFRRVYVVIRRTDLSATMSRYLIDRINATNNITLIPHSEVTTLYGESYLKQIELTDRTTRRATVLPLAAVFSFLGAIPRTQWLPEEIKRDQDGFVLTGFPPRTYLETTVPGIYAAGDVRSGSVKRVATAAGEGAMVIPFVHKYLEYLREYQK